MAQPNQLNPVVDTINAKKVIISTTTDTTLSLSPSQSGSLILLDSVAGATITVPTAGTHPGIFYDFVVSKSVTSNTYKIAMTSGSYLLGSLLSVDTDTADAIAMFVSDPSGTATAILMNGTTTGGRIGSRYRLTSIGGTWLVEGVNYGSSTVATPFTDT